MRKWKEIGGIHHQIRIQNKASHIKLKGQKLMFEHTYLDWKTVFRLLLFFLLRMIGRLKLLVSKGIQTLQHIISIPILCPYLHYTSL
jgi:hypothetical protein